MAQSLDLTSARQRIRGGKSRGREYQVTCDCGQSRWLRKCDFKAEGVCARCQRVAAGRKGYKVTFARSGRKRQFWRKLGDWRRGKTGSSLEVQVECVLLSLGVQYEREVPYFSRKRGYLLDFEVQEPRFVIEVNGDYHHSSKEQKRRDLGKKLSLRWKGIPLLVLKEEHVPDAREHIVRFMEREL